MKKKKLAVSNSIHQIQKRIFSTQLILILLLAIVLGGAGIIINVTFETQKRDRNLQNISQTIATSPLLDDMKNSANTEYLTEYFDSLQKSLGDIDAISISQVFCLLFVFNTLNEKLQRPKGCFVVVVFPSCCEGGRILGRFYFTNKHLGLRCSSSRRGTICITILYLL